MSLRYLIRLIEAFFKKFWLIIVGSIVLGVFSFLLISLIAPNLDYTHERIGIVGRFTPDHMPIEVSEKLSTGLTKAQEDGNIVPALAKSWETTDEGKTWIFKLDDNKVWHDGKKLKASDINYEFSDAKVEVIDETTIKFNLDNNFSAFPVIVTKPVFKKGLLGTGEWKVKKISLVGGYIQELLIRNPKVGKVTYKFYPSEDRLRLAFKLGEIDIVEKLQDISMFDTWKTVDIKTSVSYSNFVGIFINTEGETFADKTLRQSLAYAIDKDSLSDARAIGPISPNSWSYNPQVKPYTIDLEKSKDLKDLNIKLSTLPNLLKLAEKVAADWRSVGMSVEIETVSEVPEDYQALLATVDIPKDPDQYSLWHSTQTATNISHFKNARIDKLLEDGRKELDQETRKKIYLDFQRFLVEDVPAIFLYHPTFYTISRK